MREFVGCKAATEISKVKRPANRLSQHLVAKSEAAASNPSTENDPMALEAADVQKAALAISNKLFLMSDVAKSHYVTLDEAGQLAFIEKSTADQTAEAEAKKAETARVAAEAEAAKAGMSAKEVALEKSVSDLKVMVADLTKAINTKTVESDVEKAAADPDFYGFPGGSAKLIPLLKSANALDADSKVAFIDVLKARATDARRGASLLGGRPIDDATVTKADQAKARVDAAVEKYATDNKVSKGDAYTAVIEKAEFAEDVEAMQAAF